MPERSQKWLLFALYTAIFILYIFVGTVAAHPFDDYIYGRHAQYFYYLNVNPAYGLPMGLYYDFINIGGYFVTIILGLAGIVNVLTTQIGVKIPFIGFTFLTAYLVSRILKDMGHDGRYASLILLTSPVYFFTSVIYGSAIVISEFFLVYSIFLLFGRRSLLSAVFFGMAIGSYLYPLLSLPVLARYLYKREGKKVTLIYLAVTAFFSAIGQLIVLYIYVRMGLYSISPNVPSGYLSSSSLPYYSIFDLLKILKISSSIPGILYSYSYYITSLVASFSYFLIKEENVDKSSLLIFLMIQGVFFAALNPGNLPSYMVAMIPFAIMIAVLSKRWIIIGMVWISSFLSFLVIQAINQAGLFIYFSDVNIKILTIKNPVSSRLVYFFGFLYSLSLLLTVPISLRLKLGSATRFRKTLVSQFSTLGILCLIGILVLVPVVADIPSTMYLSSNLNSFDAQPVNEFLSGHSLSVEYLIPTVGFLSSTSLSYFLGTIRVPSQFITEYNYSRNFIPGIMDFTEGLSLDYPIDDVVIELYSKETGTANLQLENSTSALTLYGSVISTNNYTVFKYIFSHLLAGSYQLKVESTVPIYMYNDSSVSIFLGGVPQVGITVINKIPLQGSSIPSYLLKSKLQVTFMGPFLNLPPFIPSVVVYLAKNLVTLDPTATIEGGFMFSLLVGVPVYALFSRSKWIARVKTQ